MKPPVRSYLYVPGYDGRRIEKALTGEADAVVLDLEDAVAPNRKEEARETVARVLESEPEKSVFVRVNAVGTELSAADIEAGRGVSAPVNHQRRRGAIARSTSPIRPVGDHSVKASSVAP